MLRALAVTAPHWVQGLKNTTQLSLNSKEPFSLENAIRLAAHQAKNGFGEWGKSNWSDEKKLTESVLLYEYFEDQKEDFINKLDELKPNFLLIGTMTLGFAGAIQIATIAKQKFGNNICIIIGGKHIIETTYFTDGKISVNKNCTLSLMKSGEILKVFDGVVSGDGEEIIAEIGNIISRNGEVNIKFSNYKQQLSKAKGKWLMGWLNADNSIDYVSSQGQQLNQNELPYPIEIFMPKSNFPIFNSDVTAHIYGYQSKGCPYDCFFCSEKATINGKLQNQETSAIHLINQMRVLKAYGDSVGYTKLSAFIEDSVLLGGSKKALNHFSSLLKQEKLGIKFGGQLTIDLVLNKDYQEILASLAENGLTYLFIGLETNNEEIAGKMSKNTNKKNNWIVKTEAVLAFLNKTKIDCGFSVLFGLGETTTNRIELFNKLDYWQKSCGQPKVISLNMATKHPLLLEKNVNYINWGTAYNSPYLDIFLELFGEASELYCFENSTIGTLDELKLLRDRYLQLSLKN